MEHTPGGSQQVDITPIGAPEQRFVDTWPCECMEMKVKLILWDSKKTVLAICPHVKARMYRDGQFVGEWF